MPLHLHVDGVRNYWHSLAQLPVQQGRDSVMAKVAVIGTGTIGTELREQLIQSGHDVRVMVSRKEIRLFEDNRPASLVAFDGTIVGSINASAPDIDAVMLAIPNGDKGRAELAYMNAFHDKHLVTCAKAAHAYQYAAVRTFSKPIGRRATVGGGTDMLEVLRRRQLQREDVTIHAVINGTLNHVWSTIQTGGSFAEAVSDAKDLKYAEPGNDDLVGIVNDELLDVAMKAAIIRNVALQCGVEPCTADDFTIVPLTWKDIMRLTSRNARYRFITSFSSVDDVDEIEEGSPGSIRAVCGRWRITGGFRDVKAESPWFDFLREVGGVKNGFVIHNARGKDTGNSLTGPGAGPVVTAKAMVRDLHDLLSI